MKLKENELLILIKSEKNMEHYLLQNTNEPEKIDPMIWEVHLLVAKNKQMKVLNKFLDTLYQKEKNVCCFLPECMIQCRVYSKLKIPHRVSQNRKLPYDDIVRIINNKQKVSSYISTLIKYYNVLPKINETPRLGSFDFQMNKIDKFVSFSDYRKHQKLQKQRDKCNIVNELHRRENIQEERIAEPSNSKILTFNANRKNINAVQPESKNKSNDEFEFEETPPIPDRYSTPKYNGDSALKTEIAKRRRLYYSDSDSEITATSYCSNLSTSATGCKNSPVPISKSSTTIDVTSQRPARKSKTNAVNKMQRTLVSDYDFKIVKNYPEKYGKSSLESTPSSTSSRSFKKLYIDDSAHKKKRNKHEDELAALSNIMKTRKTETKNLTSIAKIFKKLSTSCSRSAPNSPRKSVTDGGDTPPANIDDVENYLNKEIDSSGGSSTSAKESDFSFLKIKNFESVVKVRNRDYRYGSTSSESEETFRSIKSRKFSIGNLINTRQNIVSSESETPNEHAIVKKPNPHVDASAKSSRKVAGNSINTRRKKIASSESETLNKRATAKTKSKLNITSVKDSKVASDSVNTKKYIASSESETLNKRAIAKTKPKLNITSVKDSKVTGDSVDTKKYIASCESESLNELVVETEPKLNAFGKREIDEADDETKNDPTTTMKLFTELTRENLHKGGFQIGRSNDENDSDLTLTNFDFKYISSSSDDSDCLYGGESPNYDLAVCKATSQVLKLNSEQIVPRISASSPGGAGAASTSAATKKIGEKTKRPVTTSTQNTCSSQTVSQNTTNTSSSQMAQFRSLTWDELPDEVEMAMTTENDKIHEMQKSLSKFLKESKAGTYNPILDSKLSDQNSNSSHWLDDDFFDF